MIVFHISHTEFVKALWIIGAIIWGIVVVVFVFHSEVSARQTDQHKAKIDSWNFSGGEL